MIRFFILLIVITSGCSAQPGMQERIITGAEQLDYLIQRIEGQKVGLLVNQTSQVGNIHLVDTLKSRGVNVVKIFSPEHGFRGTADAGEMVSDELDGKTGLPIVSLYGTNRKPTAEQLSNLDVVLFDVQDVGARFYTYISTLHYLMEACAENGVKVMVLDRPNPNGYVDGPVMKPGFTSFVGMHPIPIAHGLTVGELALMINGEGWLAGEKKCDLEIIKLQNYTHAQSYSLPVKPSPNLPNDHAIALYPSICLFEGTALSVGRGTLTPFELIGHPSLSKLSFFFTPVDMPGMSVNPPFEGQVCYGIDLRNESVSGFSLQYLIDAYQQFPEKEKFFNAYFEKLAGTDQLQAQIEAGMTEEQIRATWQADLSHYKEIRKKYLLYP